MFVSLSVWVSLSLKLAIKLDPDNMEAEKLMKQAMSKMAAMDGELKEGMEQQQKRTADAQKKTAAAKVCVCVCVCVCVFSPTYGRILTVILHTNNVPCCCPSRSR